MRSSALPQVHHTGADPLARRELAQQQQVPLTAAHFQAQPPAELAVQRVRVHGADKAVLQCHDVVVVDAVRDAVQPHHMAGQVESADLLAAVGQRQRCRQGASRMRLGGSSRSDCGWHRETGSAKASMLGAPGLAGLFDNEHWLVSGVGAVLVRSGSRTSPRQPALSAAAHGAGLAASASSDSISDQGHLMHTLSSTTLRGSSAADRPAAWPLTALMLLGACLLVLAGCASMPPPTAQMAVSTAAVAHAAAAGATELAPLEMSMARDKMVRAQAALVAKDNAGALALAQQAQLDAQLAEAKTESAKAATAAKALQEASTALRDEMARKPK
jgi:hypothetical protein